MMAQATQQQIAQRQYQLAVAKQQQRQQELEQRRYWSQQKRDEIASRRQRTRDFLARQKSGTAPSNASANKPAATQSAFTFLSR